MPSQLAFKAYPTFLVPVLVGRPLSGLSVVGVGPGSRETLQKPLACPVLPRK